MKAIRQSLALALTLGAAATLHVPAAQAQTVNPVPAPTIINSVPYTISTSGYYQLGANFQVTNTSGNIITIAVSNVTLDFGGHFISGPTNAVGTSTLFGVNANTRNNINIINGTVANCYEGIAFFGDGNATDNYNNVVNNMLVTNCSHVGINFQNTFYSRATNNVVTDTGGATATNGTGNYAIFGQGTTSSFSGNILTTVTGPSNSTSSAYGIFVPNGFSAIAVRNQVFSSYFGIYFDGTAGSGKYQDNLTVNVTSPFEGGTDAGGNN